MLSFILYMYPELALLAHLIILFITFFNVASVLFSIVALLVNIPINNVQELISISLIAFITSSVFDNSHPLSRRRDRPRPPGGAACCLRREKGDNGVVTLGVDGVLDWRIPGTGESGGLPSMGSHRVRHN